MFAGTGMRKGVDSTEAWLTATAALVILAIAFGSPHIASTGLKTIAADLGGQRSVPSAASALAWLGTGVGGIMMGLIAERIGVRFTAMFGAAMVAIGLAIASGGATWQLYLGHGIFIGLLGNAGINAPLYVYVTRWFDKRRGAAIALIASGQYAAGAIWPPIFERTIAAYGWQQTMLGFGLLIAVVVVPLAGIFLKRPPEMVPPAGSGSGKNLAQAQLGISPVLVFSLLCAASFLCCVAMAMPQAHIIALCGDLGFLPGRGAAMLSLLLTCAFFSRQFWGWLSDRIGGLLTLLICSGAQAIAMLGFLVTQDEAGLFAVATFFGLGFSGLIPAYIFTARQLFPANEASWRMPTLLLTGTAGMAFGGWSAGAIHDHYGFYQPAFATGLGANVVNFAILAALVGFWWRTRQAAAGAMDARPAGS
jgi:MFS family permease